MVEVKIKVDIVVQPVIMYSYNDEKSDINEKEAKALSLVREVDRNGLGSGVGVL